MPTVTTQDAVFRALATAVQGAVSFHSSRVYWVGEPIFDERDDKYIQLQASEGNSNNPNTGTGLWTQRINIHYWLRLHRDYSVISDERITNAADGVIALANTVRDSLRWDYVSNEVYAPVVFEQLGTPTVNTNVGYATMFDVILLRYLAEV